MKIKSLQLKNFRSYIDSGQIDLDQINVIVGANNAGKSSIIRAIHHLQSGLNDVFGDVRVGSQEATVEIALSAPFKGLGKIPHSIEDIIVRSVIQSTDRRGGNQNLRLIWNNQDQRQTELLKNVEPHHFIVPFLSKRKAMSFSEDIREAAVFQVPSNMANLSAKLSRLANPHFPTFQEYRNACEEILGFVVTAIPSVNGQRPGIYLPNQEALPIEQMGEGVPNIVYLLSQLAASREKLFLIEEPENDLHPHALKALLDLIISSSKYNQFVISTHSNIVVSHLCSNNASTLLKVTAPKNKIPTESTIAVVPPAADQRIQVLQELGYAFSDFNLWDGWLLLEESSAERIIKDYLIPWFAPKLGRIRTIAAGGIGNVEPAFIDLYRLMLFTHLQPAYSGRAWVRVDAGEQGEKLIENLIKKFPNAPQENFSTFKNPQFENYYPAVFSEKITAVFSEKNRQKQRDLKRQLLHEVIMWIDEDTERAKKSLAQSAHEVIQDLRKIELQLTKLGG